MKRGAGGPPPGSPVGAPGPLGPLNAWRAAAPLRLAIGGPPRVVDDRHDVGLALWRPVRLTSSLGHAIAPGWGGLVTALPVPGGARWRWGAELEWAAYGDEAEPVEEAPASPAGGAVAGPVGGARRLAGAVRRLLPALVSPARPAAAEARSESDSAPRRSWRRAVRPVPAGSAGRTPQRPVDVGEDRLPLGTDAAPGLSPGSPAAPLGGGRANATVRARRAASPTGADPAPRDALPDLVLRADPPPAGRPPPDDRTGVAGRDVVGGPPPGVASPAGDVTGPSPAPASPDGAVSAHGVAPSGPARQAPPPFGPNERRGDAGPEPASGDVAALVAPSDSDSHAARGERPPLGAGRGVMRRDGPGPDVVARRDLPLAGAGQPGDEAGVAAGSDMEGDAARGERPALGTGPGLVPSGGPGVDGVARVEPPPVGAGWPDEESAVVARGERPPLGTGPGLARRGGPGPNVVARGGLPPVGTRRPDDEVAVVARADSEGDVAPGERPPLAPGADVVAPGGLPLVGAGQPDEESAVAARADSDGDAARGGRPPLGGRPGLVRRDGSGADVVARGDLPPVGDARPDDEVAVVARSDSDGDIARGERPPLGMGPGLVRRGGPGADVVARGELPPAGDARPDDEVAVVARSDSNADAARSGLPFVGTGRPDDELAVVARTDPDGNAARGERPSLGTGPGLVRGNGPGAQDVAPHVGTGRPGDEVAVVARADTGADTARSGLPLVGAGRPDDQVAVVARFGTEGEAARGERPPLGAAPDLVRRGGPGPDVVVRPAPASGDGSDVVARGDTGDGSSHGDPPRLGAWPGVVRPAGDSEVVARSALPPVRTRANVRHGDPQPERGGPRTVAPRDTVGERAYRERPPLGAGPGLVRDRGPGTSADETGDTGSGSTGARLAASQRDADVVTRGVPEGPRGERPLLGTGPDIVRSGARSAAESRNEKGAVGDAQPSPPRGGDQPAIHDEEPYAALSSPARQPGIAVRSPGRAPLRSARLARAGEPVVAGDGSPYGTAAAPPGRGVLGYVSLALLTAAPASRPDPATAAAVTRLTGVRVDDAVVRRGPAVERAARALGTAAFTYAGTVHLPDRHGPLGTPAARDLLAHELTHVAQHRRATLDPAHRPTTAALETEARSVARQVGRPTTGRPEPPPRADTTGVLGENVAPAPDTTPAPLPDPTTAAADAPAERRGTEPSPVPDDAALDRQARLLYPRVRALLDADLARDRQRAARPAGR